MPNLKKKNPKPKPVGISVSTDMREKVWRLAAAMRWSKTEAANEMLASYPEKHMR